MTTMRLFASTMRGPAGAEDEADANVDARRTARVAETVFIATALRFMHNVTPISGEVSAWGNQEPKTEIPSGLLFFLDFDAKRL